MSVAKNMQQRIKLLFRTKDKVFRRKVPLCGWWATLKFICQKYAAQTSEKQMKP